MSAIRVTYSGMISFIVGFGGLILGLIFTLMITRKLVPEEFAIWSLLLSMVNYFLISGTIISYWTTRQIARDEKVGKTSIISSLLLSIIAIPIFIIYANFISTTSSVEFEILLLGLLLLPINFMSQTLAAINYSYKPHTLSYVLTIFAALKIPLALVLVVVLNLGIEGAISALFIASIGKIIFQYFLVREKLKDSFSIIRFKKLLKISWIPSFAHFPNYLILIDVALYPIITGSVLGLAFYQAAFTLGLLVANAGTISQALYPKLLAQKNFDGINKNITHFLYFAIPLLGIVIIFSKPGLYALNPVYQDAWILVIILALKIFLKTFWSIPAHILQGTDQVDLQHNPTFSKLLRSNIFKIPAFNALFYISYIALLIVLLFSTKNILNEFDVILWWAFLGLIIELALSIFLWLYAKKHSKISFPLKNVSKYVIATLIFSGIFILISDDVIIYEPSIYKFLPSVLLLLVLCCITYITITYMIDSEIRNLFKSIINEIKKIS